MHRTRRRAVWRTRREQAEAREAWRLERIAIDKVLSRAIAKACPEGKYLGSFQELRIHTADDAGRAEVLAEVL